MTLLARQGRGVAAVFAVLALLTPAAAQAASQRPAVTTRSASSITMSSARLTGTIDPNRHTTTYFFQIGTTSLYGMNTVVGSAGHGTKARKVSAPVNPLMPFTKYHYRLIAHYGNAFVKGKDKTFTTKKQPLGLSLTATPNPVRFNGPTTLSGALGGTGNAHRNVVLQFNAFPFTAGFADAVNAQVTDLAGNFAFPVLNVPVNTQYRVALRDTPAVVSPVVTVGVKVRVSTRLRHRRVKRGHRARFSGVITPANDGAPVAVQRLIHHTWVTVATTKARHGSATASTYRRRVKVRHSGTFRVVVTPGSGAYVVNHGRRVKVRVRR